MVHTSSAVCALLRRAPSSLVLTHPSFQPHPPPSSSLIPSSSSPASYAKATMLRATTCLLTFIFALAVLSTSAHLEPRPLGTHALAARRASASFQSKWYQSNYKNGASPPGASAKDAAGQKVIISNAGGGDNKSQRKSCPTVFIGGAAVDGSPAGWKKLPKITGFKLSRSFLKIDGASQVSRLCLPLIGWDLHEWASHRVAPTYCRASGTHLSRKQ